MVNCDGDDEMLIAAMIESGAGDENDLVKSLSSGVVRHSDELLNEPTGDNSMMWFCDFYAAWEIFERKEMEIIMKSEKITQQSFKSTKRVCRHRREH